MRTRIAQKISEEGRKPIAGIAVLNGEVGFGSVSQFNTEHCVVGEVLVPDFSFYIDSCYFQYREGIERHLAHLSVVISALRGKRIVVAVDTNANSELWGQTSHKGTRAYERGVAVEEFISPHGLCVLNRAGEPATFNSVNGESWIDVTLCSANMVKRVQSCRVRPEWVTSDHRVIDFVVRTDGRSDPGVSLSSGRFSLKNVNLEVLDDRIRVLTVERLEKLPVGTRDEVEDMTRALSETLVEACESAKLRRTPARKSNPW